MRVAIEIPFVEIGTPGGWIYYTEALLRELAGLDKENEYLVFNFFFRSYASKLARIYCPDAPNFRRLVKRWPDSLVTKVEWGLRVPWIEGYLRAKGVRVFHAVRPPCSALVPFVTTSHDIMYLRHPEHMYPAMRWGWDKSGLPGLKLASRVLVHSEYHKKELVEFLGVDERKIRVTPSGANTHLFFPVKDAQRLEEACRRLKLPERFILMMGPYLRWWCRYDIVIEAFKGLSARRPGLKLVLVGDDNSKYLAALEEQAARLGISDRLLSLGRIPQADLLSVCNLALCNVYPAWDSGTSFNILDCMSAGLPVVTSRASLLPEMLGEAGIWADPQSPADMEAVLGRVVDDEGLRRAKSEEGLRLARQRTWTETARKTLAAYREAAG